MRQLLIDFEEPHYPSFESFLGCQNQELLALLKSDEVPLLLIWGGKGIGKSHLLKAWVKHQWKAGRESILLNTSRQNFPKELSANHAVAIDDIHCFNEEAQLRLFHLFNEVVDMQGCLLISSEVPPKQLTKFRKDLRTRLGLCLIYEVYPLKEQEKLELMRQFVASQQSNVSEEVLQYLILRAPRNINFLLNTLQQVDIYAMKHHRKITVPLLKQFLEDELHE
ncbi:MAG: DnaA/Hda family protein [Neisseriaceae bacterium]